MGSGENVEPWAEATHLVGSRAKRVKAGRSLELVAQARLVAVAGAAIAVVFAGDEATRARRSLRRRGVEQAAVRGGVRSWRRGLR